MINNSSQVVIDQFTVSSAVLDLLDKQSIFQIIDLRFYNIYDDLDSLVLTPANVL